MHTITKLALITIVAALTMFVTSSWASVDDELILIPGTRGYLGVTISEVTKENVGELKLSEERGVVIDHVEKDSPAAAAGLQEKDVVVEYQGVRVEGVAQFMRLVRETPPGRTVRIVVVRQGARQNITATLEGPKAARGRVEIHRDGGSFVFDTDEFAKRMEKFRVDMERVGRELAERAPQMWRGFYTSRGRLGVTLQSLTPQLGDYFGVKEGKGALITSVEKESAAEKAGLKAGDIIIAIDGKPVDSTADVVGAVREKKEGALEIKVLRDRHEQTLVAQLEKREAPKPVPGESFKFRPKIRVVAPAPITTHHSIV